MRIVTYIRQYIHAAQDNSEGSPERGKTNKILYHLLLALNILSIYSSGELLMLTADLTAG